ncbi:O-antigen ligase family protein [Polaromonas sp.]|uniref:O-antigen ligase family protein n=1 Tax=Polaromonas sp. TaxID=1869339 RepID=UPI003BB6D91C
MQQIVIYFILVTGAILAAFAVSLSMVGTVQLTSRRATGYMHLIFYAMVLMVALSTVFSARDLTVASTLSADLQPEIVRDPFLTVIQRLVSLLLVAVTGERILSYGFRREKTASASPVLLITFILFWICTVAAPAFLGAKPFVSHDYAYTLVIGSAAVLVTGTERDLAFKAARNALLLFMVVSLLLIPVKPTLVLDFSYNQGLLPGIPRLAGLAVHAVSLGILAQLSLLCLIAVPYQRRWLNVLAWSIGLAVLFLAQSKTSWISFILCLFAIMAVRHAPGFWRRAGDPVRPELGIVSIVMFMLVVLGTVLIVMFGDLDAKLSNFFSSSEGAQLASLTGRDKIWAIAYEEWLRNPVFGYGPTIWDEVFRRSIGMPNASHAHNQFMDTLSRSGSVGAVSLVIYALTLLVLSVRYARASRGLTLALFLALAIRSISEVPLSLFGYGEELLTHLLLLMALGASAKELRVPKTTSDRSPAPPASSRLFPAEESLANARVSS